MHGMMGTIFVAGGGDEGYDFLASVGYLGHGFCGRCRR